MKYNAVFNFLSSLSTVLTEQTNENKSHCSLRMVNVRHDTLCLVAAAEHRPGSMTKILFLSFQLGPALGHVLKNKILARILLSQFNQNPPHTLLISDHPWYIRPPSISVGSSSSIIPPVRSDHLS